MCGLQENCRQQYRNCRKLSLTQLCCHHRLNLSICRFFLFWLRHFPSLSFLLHNHFVSWNVLINAVGLYYSNQECTGILGFEFLPPFRLGWWFLVLISLCLIRAEKQQCWVLLAGNLFMIISLEVSNNLIKFFYFLPFGFSWFFNSVPYHKVFL